MNTKFFLDVCLAVALCSCATTTSTTTSTTQREVNCSRPRWNLFEVVFVVDEPLSDTFAHALWRWQHASEVKLTTISSPSQHPISIDNVNRVGTWADGAWPYPKEASAVTIVYKTGLRIDEVDIALNPTLARSMSKVDQTNTLAHELGHALGLVDVKDDASAVMFFSVTQAQKVRSLSARDVDDLRALYECPRVGA